MQMTDLLAKKRDGGALSTEEIDFMIQGYRTHGGAQQSAAVYSRSGTAKRENKKTSAAETKSTGSAGKSGGIGGVGGQGFKTSVSER